MLLPNTRSYVALHVGVTIQCGKLVETFCGNMDGIEETFLLFVCSHRDTILIIISKKTQHYSYKYIASLSDMHHMAS